MNKFTKQQALHDIKRAVGYFKRGKKTYRWSIYCKGVHGYIGNNKIHIPKGNPDFGSYIEEVPYVGY